MTDAVSGPLKLTINPLPQQAETVADTFWSGEAPSFLDFLDIINPLQHTPIVSSIYQAMTGDTISTAARLAGGALFGGPIGFIASLFDTIVTQESGKDVAGNVMAMLDGDFSSLPSAVEAADAASVADSMGPHRHAANSAYLKAASLVT